MQRANISTQVSPSRRQTYTSSLEIARFTLMSYIRSGWVLLDIILVWLIYSVFFSATKTSAHTFFDISIPCMAAETILGSIIFVSRCMKSNVYLPLARLSSRSPYLYGIVIASSVLRIILYLLLLLTMAMLKNITDINWLNGFYGSLGLILICQLCSLLAIILSRPIATRPTQIVFLSWIVIVLYSNTPAAIDIARYLQILQLPLRPIALCYQLSSQGSIASWDWIGVVIMFAYMAIIIALGTAWFAKRDLYLS